MEHMNSPEEICSISLVAANSAGANLDEPMRTTLRTSTRNVIMRHHLPAVKASVSLHQRAEMKIAGSITNAPVWGCTRREANTGTRVHGSLSAHFQ